jgi:hypothetical protein
MTERQMTKLLLAEDILLELHEQLKGTWGHGTETKRLDTILRKLNELKGMKGPKRNVNFI